MAESKQLIALSEFWQALGPWQNLVLISIPLLAWLARAPLARFLLYGMKSFLNGLGLEVSENLENSLVPALQAIVVSFGVLIANEHMGAPEPYFTIVRNLLISACVAALFSVAYAMCVFIPQLVKRNIRRQSTFLLRISRVLVLFIGIAAILKVWGIDIGPALTGMGVLGAALALAAQDSVNNLLGGLNNAVEHRFREGDLIRVDGVVEGYVESVDLRSTRIRRLDTAPVHVPNSELANRAVINFGRRPNRRIYWKVALTFATPRPVLLAIRDRIERYIDESGLFEARNQAGRNVRVDGLNESSIDLLVHCFTKASDYSAFLEARESLALAILEIVEDEGGEIAFPSQSLYVNLNNDGTVSGDDE